MFILRILWFETFNIVKQPNLQLHNVASVLTTDLTVIHDVFNVHQ